MSAREWAATWRDYQRHDGIPYTPEPPDGAGWRLIAAVPTVTPDYNGTHTGTIWYWERDVAPRKKPGASRKGAER